MNLFKFSVSTTNIFPCANSKNGGQLLSEFNILSRERVMTDPGVPDGCGPSFVHSVDDFHVTGGSDNIISYQVDDKNNIGNVPASSSQITIGPGKGIINGHYVELTSSEGITIDLLDENRKSPNPVSGRLCIGLKANYSETTLAPEDGEYYKGISVVILPEEEFKLPKDAIGDTLRNRVTADILLATFTYINNTVSNIKQNDDKIKYIPGCRVKLDKEAMKDEGYVNASNLNVDSLYTFSGQSDGKGNRFCDSTDALMVWDSHPTKELLNAKNISDFGNPTEAQFVQNTNKDKVSLVIPHKQPHGMTVNGVVDNNKKAYYIPKVLDIPNANYSLGTPGLVSKELLDIIKSTRYDIRKLYAMPGEAGMVAYVDSINDLNDLPPIMDEWRCDNYVVVGQDYYYANANSDQQAYMNAPTTAYFIRRGSIVETTLNQSDLLINTVSHCLNNMTVHIPDVYPDKGGIEAASTQLINEISEKLKNYIIRYSNSNFDTTEVVVYDWNTEDFVTNESIYYNNVDEDVTWVPVTTKPSDWDTNYRAYATKGEGEDEYSPIPAGSVPTFEAGKYYVPSNSITINIPPKSDKDPHNIKVICRGLQANPDGGRLLFNIDKPDNFIKNAYGLYTNLQYSITCKSSMDPAQNVNLGIKLNSDVWIDCSCAINGTQHITRQISQLFNESVPTGFDLYYKGTSQIDYLEIEISPVKLLYEDDHLGDREITVGDHINVSIDGLYGNNERYETSTKIYVSKIDTSKEYNDKPILITGQIDRATTTTVGGFLNVEDAELDAGYVYMDSDGHLRLLDYALLRSGTAAYQLGEDFVIPAGVSLSEIQTYLDEYVNERIAFPNEKVTKEYNGAIHITFTLPSVESSSEGEIDDNASNELNIYGIDSRFNTAVYLHILGDGGDGITINIMDCEKLRIDGNLVGNPTINLYRTNLFYDYNILNKLSNISGLRLWYEMMSDSDSGNIFVDDMTVYVKNPTQYAQNIQYWNETHDDTHLAFALKGLTFDSSGTIVGATIFAQAGNIDGSDGVIVDKFDLPQGSDLIYPIARLSNSIIIDGHFLTSSTNGDTHTLYDVQFTAITPRYDSSDNIITDGYISTKIQSTPNIVIKTKVNSIPGWSKNDWHKFDGYSL